MTPLFVAALRTWRRIKAAAVQFMARSRWGAVMLGRTRFPYASFVGDGRGNAIVMAVVFWFCRTFPEAPLMVNLKRNGDLVPQPDHRLSALIRRPNPFYSGILLWWGTLADWMLSGNGYWIKVRSRAGLVVQLWWAPSTTMKPVRPDRGTDFISHYEYNPNGVPVNYAPSEVVHFRYGLNPADGGLTGLSPLAALLREVFTDDEAANFTASLLRNLGVPGVILSPKGDQPVEGDPQAIKDVFRQTFGGDNAGEPMVNTVPVDVTVLSFNPQQMELTALRRIPEERVAAIFGVPAVVVGLGAGLDRSTYNNYSEAREAAYEQNVIPSQALIAADVEVQLLPDFGDPAKLEVGFDLSRVRVLQEDQNAIAERANGLLLAGQIMLDEARAMVGKPPVEGGRGEVFYVPNTITVTPADMLVPPEPEPVPLTLPPGGVLPEEEEVEEPPMKRRSPGRTKALSEAEWTARQQADVGALTEELETSLAALFRQTGRRVTVVLEEASKRMPVLAGGNGYASDLKALPDDLADLVPADHAREMGAVVGTGHRAAIGRAAAAAEAGLGLSFQLPTEVVDSVLAELALRIVGIADTTRDDVRRVIRDGLAAGDSIDGLRDRLRGLFLETYRNRARAIARTESATAYNRGAVLGYRQSGVVQSVRVHDGTDVDEACRAANGATWTLERAEAEPLQHPNCVRAFAPLVERTA